MQSMWPTETLLLPNCDAKVQHKITETKEENPSELSSFFQSEYQVENATRLATALEGSGEHSVRNQLGQHPSNREITDKVQQLINPE